MARGTKWCVRKSRGMRATFLGLFATLVVLPILVVLLATVRLQHRQLTREAAEKNLLKQESVAATLQEEVREASLSLSTLLLANESQVLNLVNKPVDGTNERYTLTQTLHSLYSYTFFTRHDVVAIHFYQKDGSYYDLGAALSVSQEQLKQQPWYQAMVDEPGVVHIGYVGQDILTTAKQYQPRNLLVAAISFEDGNVPGSLAYTCLYFESAAIPMLERFNEEVDSSKTFLMAEDGTLYVGDEAYREELAGLPALRDAGALPGRWRVSAIPNTGLWVVSVTETGGALAPFYSANGFILLIALGIFLLYFLFSMFFLKRIIDPITQLHEGMVQLQEGDFGHRLVPQGQREIRELVETYNEMAGRIQELVQENRLREREKYAEEFKALQAEINPHFLVNTVNTIRLMANIAQFESIEKMSASLMEILVSVLRSSPEPHTLRQEVRLLRSYLNIMELRYSGAFEVTFDIAPGCEDCILPKLILQPIIENSIQHGLAGKAHSGHIRMRAVREGALLVVTVWDDGVGMDEAARSRCLTRADNENGGTVGLSNVQRRIQLRYGEAYGLVVNSVAGEYCEVSLRIPAVTDAGEGSDV